MDFISREVEPPINFYLSFLEDQVRCELKDSEARLRPGKSEGRVHLDIQEDLPANFLDYLQENREKTKLQEGAITNLTAALKKSECLNAEYAAQLQEEKQANTKLSAALKEAEQQLESNCIKYEEDEAQLLKGTPK